MAKKIERIKDEDLQKIETNNEVEIKTNEEVETQITKEKIEETNTELENEEIKEEKVQITIHDLISMSSCINVSLQDILLAYKILKLYPNDFNTIQEVISTAKKMNRITLKEALMYLEIVGK